MTADQCVTASLLVLALQLASAAAIAVAVIAAFLFVEKQMIRRMRGK
jgi:hypothetical protein